MTKVSSWMGVILTLKPAVHARGGFRYLQPANDEPLLGIGWHQYR